MKTHQLSTKLIVPVALIAVACIAGGTVFAISTFNKKDDSETAQEQPAEDDGSAVPETVLEVSEEEGSGTPIQYGGDDPNIKEELTGSISQTSLDGDKLLIRLNIDQTLSSGTCKLSMTSPEGGSYSATASIISTGSSYSSCEGFDVPLDSLKGSSNWLIEVSIESGDKIGKISGSTAI